MQLYNDVSTTSKNSTKFKQQILDISTVLNNTNNTTQLLTSFNSLSLAQQKALLSSTLLTKKQKEQCATMLALSSANKSYTAEELAKISGVSAETLATWGLTESTDTLTFSELAEKAVSDAQAKTTLAKIISHNAEAVANGEVTASTISLTASEGAASIATGAFTTAIKANITALWTWMTTNPLGWLIMLAGGVFAAIKAYDALTTSVKEQKEKMENSLSSYKDTQNELSNITTELESQEQAMNDLLSKDKLTYAEKGQLEELKGITKELNLQKDIEEEKEKKEQKKLAKDAANLYKKQFGEYDISENKINEYQQAVNSNGAIGKLTGKPDDISAMIAAYKQTNQLLDNAYNSNNTKSVEQYKKT